MPFKLPTEHDPSPMLALRDDIIASPVAVAVERAQVFTRVWQAHEGAPWIIKKAMALREYLQTVPLYVRDHDRLVGSISETPGAMPLFVELGIAENSIYTGENPDRQGYLRGVVDEEIRDYWRHRNLWGRYRAYQKVVHGEEVPESEQAGYKFISNQGHLSPSYRVLLDLGIDGLLAQVEERRAGETDANRLIFLTAVHHALLGLQAWATRYSHFLADGAGTHAEDRRRSELQAMAQITATVVHAAPATFWEAMQLIWLAHQAIHIEGHGYSCTPDRIDQLLYPFYLADKAAGRLCDNEALTLCENFILKQRDNTVWGVEHNLTQGLCVGGSTPDGQDQTNELSWLFIAAADAMSLPEPLVWIRWHERIDPDFFDYCLQTLGGSTCFPLMMNDNAVPAMFMALGVSREDAYNFVPVGCNEIGIPGQAYFNPNAHINYLEALELAITGGSGYGGSRVPLWELPAPESLATFDDLLAAVGDNLRHQVERSYAQGMGILAAQMTWGVTPLTSCFFDGCIEEAHDLAEGTKYNILSCGGAFFASMIDSLAAIRHVVYERKEATLAQVVQACRDNYVGHERLRYLLLDAPKQGNDDPRIDELILTVERLRDEPVKAICRDPRVGTPFGNTHITRSSAVTYGRRVGATPDGRLAGKPLASSVAAACGAEQRGPTALLNSILKLDPVKSWQCGYNVNMRVQNAMLADTGSRQKIGWLLTSYFQRGGQEMQINSVNSETLRAAQARPDEYRDLVVRIAGYSDYFVNLTADMQEEIIARTEHAIT